MPTRELEQLQSNIAQVFGSISQVRILDGVLIRDIDVVTTGTKINHLLQRQPEGWLIVDKNAVGDIHRTDWDATSITLQASANTTISMWVF